MNAMLLGGKIFLDKQEHRQKKRIAAGKPALIPPPTPKKQRKYIYETSSSESGSEGEYDNMDDFLESFDPEEAKPKEEFKEE